MVLDLLHLGIMWDLVGTCAEILDEAVDLIQRTVDLNAIPRLRRDTAKLNSDIDVGRCLDLLECISLGVLSDEVYAKR